MNDETAHGDAKSPISDTKSTPLIPISAAVPRQSAGTTTSLAIMQIMRLREQPFMLSNVTELQPPQYPKPFCQLFPEGLY